MTYYEANLIILGVDEVLLTNFMAAIIFAFIFPFLTAGFCFGTKLFSLFISKSCWTEPTRDELFVALAFVRN